MSEVALETLGALQDGLVRALDTGDIAEIETAIDALAAAVDEIRAGRARSGGRDAARSAMAANHAAQVRVNFLTDRVRRRLDSLSALRGPLSAATYRPIGG